MARQHSRGSPRLRRGSWFWGIFRSSTTTTTRPNHTKNKNNDKNNNRTKPAPVEQTSQTNNKSKTTTTVISSQQKLHPRTTAVCTSTTASETSHHEQSNRTNHSSSTPTNEQRGQPIHIELKEEQTKRNSNNSIQDSSNLPIDVDRMNDDEINNENVDGQEQPPSHEARPEKKTTTMTKPETRTEPHRLAVDSRLQPPQPCETNHNEPVGKHNEPDWNQVNHHITNNKNEPLHREPEPNDNTTGEPTWRLEEVDVHDKYRSSNGDDDNDIKEKKYMLSNQQTTIEDSGNKTNNDASTSFSPLCSGDHEFHSNDDSCRNNRFDINTADSKTGSPCSSSSSSSSSSRPSNYYLESSDGGSLSQEPNESTRATVNAMTTVTTSPVNTKSDGDGGVTTGDDDDEREDMGNVNTPVNGHHENQVSLVKMHSHYTPSSANAVVSSNRNSNHKNDDDDDDDDDSYAISPQSTCSPSSSSSPATLSVDLLSLDACSISQEPNEWSGPRANTTEATATSPLHAKVEGDGWRTSGMDDDDDVFSEDDEQHDIGTTYTLLNDCDDRTDQVFWAKMHCNTQSCVSAVRANTCHSDINDSCSENSLGNDTHSSTNSTSYSLRSTLSSSPLECSMDFLSPELCRVSHEPDHRVLSITNVTTDIATTSTGDVATTCVRVKVEGGNTAPELNTLDNSTVKECSGAINGQDQAETAAKESHSPMTRRENERDDNEPNGFQQGRGTRTSGYNHQYDYDGNLPSFINGKENSPNHVPTHHHGDDSLLTNSWSTSSSDKLAAKSRSLLRVLPRPEQRLEQEQDNGVTRATTQAATTTTPTTPSPDPPIVIRKWTSSSSLPGTYEWVPIQMSQHINPPPLLPAEDAFLSLATEDSPPSRKPLLTKKQGSSKKERRLGHNFPTTDLRVNGTDKNKKRDCNLAVKDTVVHSGQPSHCVLRSLRDVSPYRTAEQYRTNNTIHQGENQGGWKDCSVKGEEACTELVAAVDQPKPKVSITLMSYSPSTLHKEGEENRQDEVGVSQEHSTAPSVVLRHHSTNMGPQSLVAWQLKRGDSDAKSMKHHCTSFTMTTGCATTNTDRNCSNNGSKKETTKQPLNEMQQACEYGEGQQVEIIKGEYANNLASVVKNHNKMVTISFQDGWETITARIRKTSVIPIGTRYCLKQENAKIGRVKSNFIKEKEEMPVPETMASTQLRGSKIQSSASPSALHYDNHGEHNGNQEYPTAQSVYSHHNEVHRWPGSLASPQIRQEDFSSTSFALNTRCATTNTDRNCSNNGSKKETATQPLNEMQQACEYEEGQQVEIIKGKYANNLASVVKNHNKMVTVSFQDGRKTISKRIRKTSVIPIGTRYCLKQENGKMGRVKNNFIKEEEEMPVPETMASTQLPGSKIQSSASPSALHYDNHGEHNGNQEYPTAQSVYSHHNEVHRWPGSLASPQIRQEDFSSTSFALNTRCATNNTDRNCSNNGSKKETAKQPLNEMQEACEYEEGQQVEIIKGKYANNLASVVKNHDKMVTVSFQDGRKTISKRIRKTSVIPIGTMCYLKRKNGKMGRVKNNFIKEEEEMPVPETMASTQLRGSKIQSSASPSALYYDNHGEHAGNQEYATANSVYSHRNEVPRGPRSLASPQIRQDDFSSASMKHRCTSFTLNTRYATTSTDRDCSTSGSNEEAATQPLNEMQQPCEYEEGQQVEIIKGMYAKNLASVVKNHDKMVTVSFQDGQTTISKRIRKTSVIPI